MKLSMRKAYGETLAELGKTDETIVVLDADLSKSTGTYLFRQAFPDRFVDVGVAEQNLIGVAAGLASCGKKPFASTFAVFASGRAFDQIRVSVAYPCLPVRIVATHGGISVGEDGATHQALEDIALMRVLPNMTVVVPADAVEAAAVIRWAGKKLEKPVYIRLARPAVPVVFDTTYSFNFGKAVEIKKGKEGYILSTGIMLHRVLKAAEELGKEGIQVGVAHFPVVKPLDLEFLDRVLKKVSFLLTVEEHQKAGGFGSAVAEYAKGRIDLEIMGIDDKFGESGPGELLLDKYGLSVTDIYKTVKKLLKRG